MRLVPGFLDLQLMSSLLLAERCGDEARILVLGAGGGLELKAFAEWHTRWSFVGVDPSAEMLDLAVRTLGPLSARVSLHRGYIDTAPEGPFDGAACLLTLHFAPKQERLNTLRSPLVVAHHSWPQDEERKAVWLGRFVAFGSATGGIPADRAQHAAESMAAQVPALSPEVDEALLREAGFSAVELFYAAFTFRGWVAVNP